MLQTVGLHLSYLSLPKSAGARWKWAGGLQRLVVVYWWNPPLADEATGPERSSREMDGRVDVVVVPDSLLDDVSEHVQLAGLGVSESAMVGLGISGTVSAVFVSDVVQVESMRELPWFLIVIHLFVVASTLDVAVRDSSLSSTWILGDQTTLNNVSIPLLACNEPWV